MVVRLTKERDELKLENKELVEENLQLKRRCSDLWREIRKKGQSVIREMSTRIQPDLLEKYGRAIPVSVVELPRCDLKKAGSTMLEIKPRDVGTDSEDGTVGPEEIPVQTLEEGIVVAMEIQARE